MNNSVIIIVVVKGVFALIFHTGIYQVHYSLAHHITLKEMYNKWASLKNIVIKVYGFINYYSHTKS